MDAYRAMRTSIGLHESDEVSSSTSFIDTHETL